MRKKYRLLKTYVSPKGTCHAGATYTAEEWRIVWFPGLSDKDFEVKKDWFEEVKEQDRAEVFMLREYCYAQNGMYLYTVLCNKQIADWQTLQKISKVIEDVLNGKSETQPIPICPTNRRYILRKNLSKGSLTPTSFFPKGLVVKLVEDRYYFDEEFRKYAWPKDEVEKNPDIWEELLPDPPASTDDKPVESGAGKRPFNPDWARSLRDQCKTAGVPFFMKQIDKVQPIPEDLMIREFYI